MNRHESQTHTEARNHEKFSKSRGALNILKATEYKKDAKKLYILFTNLEKPTILIPLMYVAERLILRNRIQQGHKNQSS